MLKIRTYIALCFASVFITTAGCQVTVRRMSVWIYPTVAFPARSVEVGGGKQVHVPAFSPSGDAICIGARFVHINPENKGLLTTTSLLKWPAKIKEQMQRK